MAEIKKILGSILILAVLAWCQVLAFHLIAAWVLWKPVEWPVSWEAVRLSFGVACGIELWTQFKRVLGKVQD